MTRRAKPIVVGMTAYSGVVYAPSRIVRPSAQRVDCPIQYDAKRRAYVVPLGRLHDVIAALELDGYVIDASAITG
jgi:hypothetical protein